MHQNPGENFIGTIRYAYVPKNADGEYIIGLLKKAFINRLTFRIDYSVTRNLDNMIIWNIHHKTCTYGGATNFAWPDVTYRVRLSEELLAYNIK